MCDETNQKIASNRANRQSKFDTANGETTATKPSKIDSHEPIQTTEEKFTSLELDWSAIVANYSSKGFTNHEDKLIALHGLIDQTAAHNGHLTPYFGMWKELLFGQLLWEVVRPGRRLEKYIAPSFSWASVASPIRRLYRNIYEDSARRCSILAATAVDSSLNEDGKCGVITMRGKCASLRTPGNTASYKLPKDSSGAEQRVDTITIKLDSTADIQPEHIQMHLLVMDCLKGNGYTRCGQGLILRRVTIPESDLGQTGNLYERIGAFQWEFPAEDIPWWDEVDETTGTPCYPEQELKII